MTVQFTLKKKEEAKNQAYIIKIDGTHVDLDHQPTLFEAQKIVGGYVEIFPRTYLKDKTLTMIGNDEGRVKNMDKNIEASKLLKTSFAVGDILILKGWRTLK
jgi:Domain of unknown function (DUF3846)